MNTERVCSGLDGRGQHGLFSDALLQIASARQALKSFSDEIGASHLHECFGSAASRSGGRREPRSLLNVLKRYAV